MNILKTKKLCTSHEYNNRDLKKINRDTVVKNGKILRFGYTTGSCATAVISAATQMLLTQEKIKSVAINLPNGEEVIFFIDDIKIEKDFVTCSTIKDAGDDPDVTDGIKIVGESRFYEEGIKITTGIGIGIVTAKGLKCNIGEPAINPTPKKMIINNIERICKDNGYTRGIEVKLSVPNGEEIAKKTFNPRLGIIGGISILGTTGIVEPMSEKALVDTVKILIDKYKENESDENILITPGNYGRDYCLDRLGIDIEKGIKCSNYVGETLDYIVYKEYKKILIVGHLGKLVKLAGGIMNTHSLVADCRMELLALHTGLCGGSVEDMEKIMKCVTTEAAVEIMEGTGLKEKIFKNIIEKIKYHLNYRVKGKVEVEVILFLLNNKTEESSEKALSFVKLFK